jgi:hypothetical protein
MQFVIETCIPKSVCCTPSIAHQKESLDSCLQSSSTHASISHANSKHLNDFLKKERKIQVHLFRTRSSHALEALLVRLVYLWDLELVFLQLVDQLRGVELAVASAGLDDLGLLIQCEVLPGEVWADVFLEEGEDLVVGDGTGVGEVVDASILVLGHDNGSWKQIVENGVGVRDVYHSLVLGDLGDEVAGVEVVADWHSESENENIGVRFHDLCHN